jgi:hypothetical protein
MGLMQLRSELLRLGFRGTQGGSFRATLGWRMQSRWDREGVFNHEPTGIVPAKYMGGQPDSCLGLGITFARRYPPAQVSYGLFDCA